MNKKKYLPIFLILIILFSSCFGQRNRRTPIIPIPDTEFFDFTLHINMEDIIETKSGAGIRNMPVWLRTYIADGIEEVEKIETYRGKYMFIGMSEGLNFTAMNKWADNFSPTRDTIMLAARRIENKLVNTALLYPDDEYGMFFENIIRTAYSSVYPGAVKEDSYWIRARVNSEEGPVDLYVFFVLISIDKAALQDVVHDMILKSLSSSGLHADNLSANQRKAIERLQSNFFEGF